MYWTYQKSLQYGLVLSISTITINTLLTGPPKQWKSKEADANIYHILQYSLSCLSLFIDFPYSNLEWTNMILLTRVVTFHKINLPSHLCCKTVLLLQSVPIPKWTYPPPHAVRGSSWWKPWELLPLRCASLALPPTSLSSGPPPPPASSAVRWQRLEGRVLSHG